MGTITRLAWDVPVRLVPADARSSGADAVRTVRRADPGVALPGVTALRITLHQVAGRTLLERIEPEGDGPPAREPLDAVLAELCDADDEGDDEGVVPVLVDGTPFALDVLGALCRIPVGERRSYAELASASGRPRAVRAAASVMARNRVPLVLPCHRVVPSGGGTGRYGWGEAVKVALLAAERATR